MWSARNFKRILQDKGMTCEAIAEKLITEKNWVSPHLFVTLQLRGFALERQPYNFRQVIHIAEVIGVNPWDLLEKKANLESGSQNG